jgi:hypothetical protein
VRKIKAIVYGPGQMGKIITRLMVEKGVTIVGAINRNPDMVGMDLGEVAGLGYLLNVKLNNDADRVLSENQADIAVVAVYAEMERSYPMFKKCVEHGLNVISTCDEALYPWTTSPELTSKLDKLGKKYGVTITGGGFQDVFLTNQIILLSGASHTIETINGYEKYNVDDYGPVVAEWHHVGETVDKFHQREKKQGTDLSYFRMSLETIAAGLGLTVNKIQQTTRPLTEDADVMCKSLGIIIKKGLVVGRSQITEIETGQGITLYGEEVSKVYKKGEVDQNKWSIIGIPNTYLKNDRVATRLQTCTQIVNRIPDIINANAGYVTVDQLPILKYKAHPLEYYLKKWNYTPLPVTRD